MKGTVLSRVWSDGGFTVSADSEIDALYELLSRCKNSFVIPSDIETVLVGRKDQTEYFRTILRAAYRKDRVTRASSSPKR
jgi:hypothetical protein